MLALERELGAALDEVARLERINAAMLAALERITRTAIAQAKGEAVRRTDDAALIAAAPDMLAALKLAERALGTLPDRTPTEQRIYKRIHVAIAKAKGEA
jgi:hypothetical protein